jgi:hypothetical protein
MFSLIKFLLTTIYSIIFYPNVIFNNNHNYISYRFGLLVDQFRSQRIQKPLQMSAMISSASWEIVFHYPG